LEGSGWVVSIYADLQGGRDAGGMPTSLFSSRTATSKIFAATLSVNNSASSAPSRCVVGGLFKGSNPVSMGDLIPEDTDVLLSARSPTVSSRTDDPSLSEAVGDTWALAGISGNVGGREESLSAIFCGLCPNGSNVRNGN
jgi:hypothetical protein